MDLDVVPLIYSPRNKPRRLGPLGRLTGLAVGLLCLAPLVTAALLRPDPSGMGTHMALGLGACSFPRMFGIPCPTCGMTTSWAWFARGDLPASLWVQPMGALLAFFAGAGFWAGLYVVATGRAAHQLMRYVPGGYIARWFLTLALLAWAWKIFIQLHHLDGWR
jgi:hypothetical protein